MDCSREPRGNPSERALAEGYSAQKLSDYCNVIQIENSQGQVKELFFPKRLDLDRPKRCRTTFNDQQLDLLEKAFAVNQYVVGQERRKLSADLHLSETQVKVWFQNRRTKYKKDQMREKESLESKAETIAAANVMRLIEEQRALQMNLITGDPSRLPPDARYISRTHF